MSDKPPRASGKSGGARPGKARVASKDDGTRQKETPRVMANRAQAANQAKGGPPLTPAADKPAKPKRKPMQRVGKATKAAAKGNGSKTAAKDLAAAQATRRLLAKRARAQKS